MDEQHAFAYLGRLLTLSFVILHSVKYSEGQGAGPIGSISDYYDQAFGNPFLGYWKNPGNRNPYGSHTMDYGAMGSGGFGGPLAGRGSPYGSPFVSGLDRPSPGVPSYLYDRLGGNSLYGYSGLPYMGMSPMGGMYPGGAGGMYPGGGMNFIPGMGMNDAGRTPADRGLQDLLPSSYSYKPWYP